VVRITVSNPDPTITQAARARADSIRGVDLAGGWLSARRRRATPPERTSTAAAREENKAQGLNGLQERQGGVLARAASPFRAGFDLEVGKQVVRQDHQLLPRAVGRIGHGRDGVEGQPGLQLPDGLLVVSRGRP